MRKVSIRKQSGKIEINVILNFPILDFLAPLDVSMNKSFLKETACEKKFFFNLLSQTFSYIGSDDEKMTHNFFLDVWLVENAPYNICILCNNIISWLINCLLHF